MHFSLNRCGTDPALSSYFEAVLYTYLCSDHDDLQNLDSHFPGYVSTGPVLLTGAHEVVSQVVSQLLLLDKLLSHVRAAMKTETLGSSRWTLLVCKQSGAVEDNSLYLLAYFLCRKQHIALRKKMQKWHCERAVISYVTDV